MSANSSALAARPAFLKNNLFAILCAVTVSLSAFLLFLLEPLFAKLILPWFGGSAAVWATCLVFFQSALLLGYLYADIVARRLAPRQQSFLHIGLLAAGLAFLPITAHASWRPSSASDPAWRILGLLTVSIGLPFVLLSATSPLVQAWHARLRPAVEPYHLFEFSILGRAAYFFAPASAALVRAIRSVCPDVRFRRLDFAPRFQQTGADGSGRLNAANSGSRTA